jgi:hypothetical protein
MLGTHKLRRQEDSEVVAHALSALASIAEWPEGAAAVVGTGMLGHLDGLISSRNNHVRKCTCELLGNLAYHRTPAVAVMDINACATLVSFLGWA